MEQSPDAINTLRYVILLEADFWHFAFEQRILKGVLFFYQYNAVYNLENLYELYLDFLPDLPSDDESSNIEINDVISFWIIVDFCVFTINNCHKMGTNSTFCLW